jgi:Pyruvate/2-oxoacid:ferredoxin oxidoreductase gamma subunit
MEEGGQGSLVLAQFMAIAALEDGKYGQAFPFLGLSGKSFEAHTISADNLARRILGRPIINTALLGAFAAITNEITLQSALNAVRSKFPGRLGEKNAQVVQESYDQLMRNSS